VLSQIDDNGVERPVAFGSWSLTPAERGYSPQERECLAILRAVTHWRVYVVNQRFTVETDHESLKWLWTSKHENARVLRWVLRLQEYDFSVEYRKGVCHENADALSRPYTKEQVVLMEKKPESHEVLLIRLQQRELLSLAEEGRDESSCCVTLNVSPGDAEGSKPSPAAAKTPSDFDQLIALQQDSREWRRRNTASFKVGEDGVLRKEGRIVLPDAFRRKAFLELHEEVGFHEGIQKSILRVREKYFWPSLEHDVTEWCKSCITCQRNQRQVRHQTPSVRFRCSGRSRFVVSI
jgi:hypothetical protein